MTVSPDQAAIIVEKAEFIETCLKILADKQSVSPDEYAESVELKDVVERRFEKMTQACIDIARMLLTDLDANVPAANPDTMRQLVSEGVLSPETGRPMAEACGFRNIIAYEYGTVIDDEMVYEALQDLSRYRAFLVDVQEFLCSEGVM